MYIRRRQFDTLIIHPEYASLECPTLIGVQVWKLIWYSSLLVGGELEDVVFVMYS
jgi:hypothetical protein